MKQNKENEIEKEIEYHINLIDGKCCLIAMNKFSGIGDVIQDITKDVNFFIQSKEKEMLDEILNICNRGNARQNHIGKFFEIRRLCQERLSKLIQETPKSNNGKRK